jgi:signal recognition particle subunit SRP54
MEMMPGMNSKEMKGINLDDSEKEMVKTKSIIQSMTKKERKNPKYLENASRKKRIARGAGVTIQDVNKVIKGFENMKKMMKQMGNMQKGSKKGMFGKMPF